MYRKVQLVAEQEPLRE